MYLFWKSTSILHLKTVYILCEILKQTKLIPGDRNHNSGYFRVVDMNGKRNVRYFVGMFFILIDVCGLHDCIYLQNDPAVLLTFCAFYALYINLSQLRITLTLLIREIQIKIMKNHLSPSRLAKIKKSW